MNIKVYVSMCGPGNMSKAQQDTMIANASEKI